MKLHLATIFSLIARAILRLFDDETLPLAGNIAFRSLFSVFPFLIFLTALAGFLGNEPLAEKIISFLLDVAPQKLVQPLAPEIHNLLTTQRTGLLSVAALLTIWSAMSGVDSVRMALNRAYGLTETRHFLYLFLQNLLFIIFTAAVLLILALLLLVAPIFLTLIQKHAPELGRNWVALDELRYPLASAILALGLYLSHRILPNAHFRFHDIWPGILGTIIALIVLSVIFTYYLSHFNSFTNTYSSLSGVFAAMFYLYLVAIILILGGELNRVIMIYREALQSAETQEEAEAMIKKIIAPPTLKTSPEE